MSAGRSTALTTTAVHTLQLITTCAIHNRNTCNCHTALLSHARKAALLITIVTQRIALDAKSRAPRTAHAAVASCDAAPICMQQRGVSEQDLAIICKADVKPKVQFNHPALPLQKLASTTACAPSISACMLRSQAHHESACFIHPMQHQHSMGNHEDAGHRSCTPSATLSLADRTTALSRRALARNGCTRALAA